MSTERDTHFVGFAELLWSELYDHIREQTYFGDSPHEDLMHKIIAHRAYDLAKHAMKIAPVTEWEWDMRDIPDLTAWPDNEVS